MGGASGSRGWKYVFLANVFFACVSFSIVVPTLFGYLTQLGGRPLGSQPLFYAFTVSIYSVGEAIGSVLFGWLYGRAPGPKTAIMGTLSVGFAGSILFAAAGMYPRNGSDVGPWIAFTGRLVQGLWTGGQQTVEQAYLSEYVPPEELTEVTASLGSAAVLGFILGPTFATVLAFLDFKVGGGYRVDGNTAPGLFMVVIAVAMLVMTATLFHAPSRTLAESLADDADAEYVPLIRKQQLANRAKVYEDEIDDQATALPNATSVNDSDYTSAKSSPVLPVDSPDCPAAPLPPSTAGVVLCLVAFFVHFYSFAVYETIMTPLVPELYGWSPKHVDLLFVGAGVVSLLSSLGVKFLAPSVSDVRLLLASLVIGALGNAVMIDFPGYAKGHASAPPVEGFILGFVMLNIAFPIGRNVVLSLYSKILGPCPQGAYMGAIIALGAVPRAVGPFWAVYALCIPEEGSGNPHKYPTTLCHTSPGTKPETYILFGSTALAFLVMLAVAVVAARCGLLAPHPDLHMQSTQLTPAHSALAPNDVDGDSVALLGTGSDADSVGSPRRASKPIDAAVVQDVWGLGLDPQSASLRARRTSAVEITGRRMSEMRTGPGQTPTRWGSFVVGSVGQHRGSRVRTSSVGSYELADSAGSR